MIKYDLYVVDHLAELYYSWEIFGIFRHVMTFRVGVESVKIKASACPSLSDFCDTIAIE